MQVLLALLHSPNRLCRDAGREQRTARTPGAEPSPATCPRANMGTQSQVAFLHFPPQITNWLMCILITF